MDAVINLKKCNMIFEKKELRVIVPLDSAEGVRYTEPFWDYYEEDDIEKIYKLTVWDKDWINPMTYGWITWEKENSCNSDSDEELEHWQNRLQEVSSLRCNRLTKSIRCISTEVWNLPYYDGLEGFNLFLDKFERDVPEEH